MINTNFTSSCSYPTPYKDSIPFLILYLFYMIGSTRWLWLVSQKAKRKTVSKITIDLLPKVIFDAFEYKYPLYILISYQVMY